MHCRKRTSRKGQVIVIVPVVIVVMAGLLALTNDVGQLAVWGSRLQNAADASALAAGAELVQERSAGASEGSARLSASAEAQGIANLNSGSAGVQVEFGVLDESGSFVPADSTTKATAVRSVCYRNGEAPGGSVRLAWAPLIGLWEVEVDGLAVCQVADQIGGLSAGLSPFALHVNDVAPVGESMNLYPADGDDYDGVEDSTVAPGSFGLLNFDGGSCNTPELEDWILNGYDPPEPFEVDEETGGIWMDGTPGFRAALESTLEEIIARDQPLVVVLYDSLNGEGGYNVDYHCVGFVQISLTSVDLSAQDPHVLCEVDSITTVHDAVGGSGISSPNLRKVQLVR